MKETNKLMPGLQPDEERRWAQIVARAWDDEDFRRRLLAEPKKALREEGFELPDDAEVEFVEREPDQVPEGVTCLQLPPRPAEDDLIEEDLSSPVEFAGEVGNDS